MWEWGVGPGPHKKIRRLGLHTVAYREIWWGGAFLVVGFYIWEPIKNSKHVEGWDVSGAGCVQTLGPI